MDPNDSNILGETLKDSNRGAKIFFVVVAVGCVAPIAWHQWKLRQAETNTVAAIADTQRAVAAAELIRDKFYEKMILEGKTALGMTKRQVIQAKGMPSDMVIGPRIPDELRARGTVEMWDYGHDKNDKPYWVLFDLHECVLYSPDMNGGESEK